MPEDPNLATVAALIGESTRATMLLELMGGRALTATELATRAHVAPSTASEHLAQLVKGGLLTCVAQGRHRYHRLASADVARVIEALGVLTPATERSLHIEPELVEGLRFARSCYDHLAGRLGVAIVDALVEGRYLEPEGDGYRITPLGDRWFDAFGVDIAAARRARRAFARACLDWTERRPHMAGALGAALLARLVEIGWLRRVEGERALELTSLGQAGLRAELPASIHAGSGTGIVAASFA